MDCISFFCHLPWIFPFFSLLPAITLSRALIASCCTGVPASRLSESLLLKCGSWACGTTSMPHSLLQIQHLEALTDLLNHRACSSPCCGASIQLIRSRVASYQCVRVLPLDYFLSLVALSASFATGGREGKHGAMERHWNRRIAIQSRLPSMTLTMTIESLKWSLYFYDFPLLPFSTPHDEIFLNC